MWALCLQFRLAAQRLFQVSPWEPSVQGWLGQTLRGDKKSLSDFCSLFPFSCVVVTQAHLQCLAHCKRNPKPIQVYSPTATSGPQMLWKRTPSAVWKRRRKRKPWELKTGVYPWDVLGNMP